MLILEHCKKAARAAPVLTQKLFFKFNLISIYFYYLIFQKKKTLLEFLEFDINSRESHGITEIEKFINYSNK